MTSTSRERQIIGGELTYLAAAQSDIRRGLVRREDIKPYSILAPAYREKCEAIAAAHWQDFMIRVFSRILAAADLADQQNISALGMMRQIQQELATLPPPAPAKTQ